MAEQDKKKFRIEDLSESTRKKIYIISLIIIMGAVFIFWASSLNQTFKNLSQSAGEKPEITEIKNQLQELGQAFEESQQTISDVKEQFQKLASTTPTSTPAVEPDLSEEDLEEIKNIILEKTQEPTE